MAGETVKNLALQDMSVHKPFTVEQEKALEAHIEDLRRELDEDRLVLLVAEFELAARLVLLDVERACAGRGNFHPWNLLSGAVNSAALLR